MPSTVTIQMDIYQSRRKEDWLLLLLRQINLPIFWKTGNPLLSSTVILESQLNHLLIALKKFFRRSSIAINRVFWKIEWGKYRWKYQAHRKLHQVYANTKQIPGLLLFFDFEKAFDSIKWPFIERTLKYLNFEVSLVTWFKLFYTVVSKTMVGLLRIFFFESRSETGVPAFPRLHSLRRGLGKCR